MRSRSTPASVAACLGFIFAAPAEGATTVESPGLAVVGSTPSAVRSGAPVTARFALDGGAQDGGTLIFVYGLPAGEDLSSSVSSVAIDSVAVEGPARLGGSAKYDVAQPQICERGGKRTELNSTGTELTIPARSHSELVVKATVLPATRSDQPGIVVAATPLYSVLPGNSSIFHTTFRSSVTFERVAGFAEQPYLRVRKDRDGRVIAAGSLASHRRGVRVHFVGRRLRVPIDHTASLNALGSAERAFAPLGAGLREYGTAVSDADGRFRAVLTVPHATALIARTNARALGDAAGASCPVEVRLHRRVAR